MKTTAYFEQKLLERPEIQREWCQRVINNPLKEEVQSDMAAGDSPTSATLADGQVRFWGMIAEYGNKVLRVVTLEDRETIHNAFFDRSFMKKYQQEQR